jgi:tetratricopeptide (TPR) repeat protein
MGSFFRTGLLIVVLLACVAAGLYQVHPWWFRQFFVPSMANTPAPRIAQINWGDFNRFVAAAMAADAVPDPLTRCLTFPDPGGSHWSKQAVSAYCRHMAAPAIAKSEVMALIRDGHAAELDRRLSDLLHDQASRIESRGVLDVLYQDDFSDDSPEMRQALDDWKRQSPDSTFAYGASGVAYMRSAQDRRGYDFVDKTPEKNFEAMNSELAKARVDLDKSVELNPTLTPAWAAMMYAGRLDGDTRYALRAAKRGLIVEPWNYSIYDELMTMAEPKWGGSEWTMFRVAMDAHAHEAENPLLIVLRTAPPAYTNGYHGCACRYPVNLDAFQTVFDQLAPWPSLSSAAEAASTANLFQIAVVYDFETLRFNPGETDDRNDLVQQLAWLGLTQAALNEGNRAVALAPRDKDSYDSRGFAFQQADDFERAIADYRTALAMDPDDTDALLQMGVIYAYTTHEWDKAWAISDRLIKLEPDDIGGWILRFVVQKNQPRSGMRETAQYLVEHFGNNPAALDRLGSSRADMDEARRIVSRGKVTRQ